MEEMTLFKSTKKIVKIRLLKKYALFDKSDFLSIKKLRANTIVHQVLQAGYFFARHLIQSQCQVA